MRVAAMRQRPLVLLSSGVSGWHAMRIQPPGMWRRIGARLPEITMAIAIAAIIGTVVWVVWSVGWQ